MKKRHFGVHHVTSSKYFQGEMMTCASCGRQQKSDPHVESNWTVIVADGKPIYVCPVCFGTQALIDAEHSS